MLPASWLRRHAYDTLRLVIAAILLVAATLKCYQLATEPVLGHGILDGRYTMMAAVEAELLLGLWILATVLPFRFWRGAGDEGLTWLAALGPFSLFTCVSLYKAVSGYATCGCLGPVKVKPVYMAIADVFVVISLLCCRPRLSKPRFDIDFKQLGVRLVGVLAIWLSVGVPAGYAMGSYRPATLSDAGSVLGDGKIVVLQPEKWIGKRLPLLDRIKIGERLDRGCWVVVFHRFGCAKCERLIRDYENAGIRFGTEKVAFVALESCGERPIRLVFHGDASGCMRGGNSWVVETPLEVYLDGGKVISVAHDAPVE